MSLTDLEKELIRLKRSGFSYSEMAKRLGISRGRASGVIFKFGLTASVAERRDARLAAQPARFWKNIDQSGGPSACWPWTAAKSSSGYGRLSFDLGNGPASTIASRAAWFLANGPIPRGAVVRHSCDNPPCCNPGHLLIGTMRDNTQDALERRRLPYGDRTKMAKLTAEQAAEIKRLAGIGGRSDGEVGALFGVSASIVRNIRRGITWRRALADHAAAANSDQAMSNAARPPLVHMHV